MVADTQLADMIARYSPDIAALGSTAIARLRAELPNAFALVYDNYNALAVGFSPSEKSSEGIFSIALYPRWVSLFFLQGAGLPDPAGLLKGGGSTVRHIVLDGIGDFDRADVRTLMDVALVSAKRRLDPGAGGRLIIKSISSRQRPRRP
jgi:hypothetical protein